MNRLKSPATVAGLIAAMAAAPVQASIFGTAHEDSLGLSGYFFMPDSARNASNGLAGSVHYGFGFNDRVWLEAHGFGAMFDSDDPTLETMGQIGGGLNLLLTPRGDRWFVTGGGGISETGDDDRLTPSSYVDAGIGWRTGRNPRSAFRWRFEARAVDHVGHDGQVDLWLGAGIEFLLSGSAPPADGPHTTPLVTHTDSDADGVADAVDKCLSTRPDRVGADGCDRPEQVITVTDLRFPSTALTLTPETRAGLDEIARAYASQLDVKIEIVGHADATHTEAFNLKLSKARAAAVRDYLVQKGIDPERVTADGLGEMRPIDSNETESGKAANRRVELHIRTHQAD